MLPELKTEVLKLGGCEVGISAVPLDAHYQGQWGCRKCGAVGRSVASYHLATAALSWARTSAASHCQKQHGVVQG